jgi:nicotinamide-nucleotide amidase
MMLDATSHALATHVLQHCRNYGWKLATAESCTGGLIGALLTSVAGSSDVLTHGFITYANEAKVQMVGVDAMLIVTHGAVSEEVARAMAQGAQRTANADIAIAVTGIAGPGGGSDAKPVGLVHMALASRHSTLHQRHLFEGDRDAIRLQAALGALEMVIQTPMV